MINSKFGLEQSIVFEKNGNPFVGKIMEVRESRMSGIVYSVLELNVLKSDMFDNTYSNVTSYHNKVIQKINESCIYYGFDDWFEHAKALLEVDKELVEDTYEKLMQGEIYNCFAIRDEDDEIYIPKLGDKILFNIKGFIEPTIGEIEEVYSKNWFDYHYVVCEEGKNCITYEVDKVFNNLTSWKEVKLCSYDIEINSKRELAMNLNKALHEYYNDQDTIDKTIDEVHNGNVLTELTVLLDDIKDVEKRKMYKIAIDELNNKYCTLPFSKQKEEGSREDRLAAIKEGNGIVDGNINEIVTRRCDPKDREEILYNALLNKWVLEKQYVESDEEITQEDIKEAVSKMHECFFKSNKNNEEEKGIVIED